MSTNRTKIIFAAIVAIVVFAAGGASAAPLTCIKIARTLSFQSHGADVITLQSFLAQDPTIYPEGVISGFFGHATEKAVQRFQAAHGIVSSGTAASTGFGAVGGRTRAALALCTSTSTPTASPIATTTPPVVQHTTPTPVVVPVVPVTPLVTVTDGATTTITLGSGVMPTFTAFNLSPRIVDLTNDSVSMYWTTSNAANCNVEKWNGSGYAVVTQSAGVNGSVNLPITDNSMMFSLNCTGIGDNSSSTAASIRRDVLVRIAHPVPTCSVTTDKSSYAYSKDTIKISWTSEGADSIAWVHGVANDPISLPYGNQNPSGSLFLSSVAGDNQTATLNVKGYGGSASCSKTFTISSLGS